MTVNTTKDGTKVTVEIQGRLDTTTAPDLEKEMSAIWDEAAEMVIDIAELEYISSAGLRVLLAAQKKMNKKGGMVVKNANESIMDIFEVTGFVDILTIQ